MVGRRWWAAQPWKLIQKPLALGLAIQMLWGMGAEGAIAAPATGNLSETSPPKTFTTLRRVLDQYQPQIKILSPKAGEILTDNSVRLSFEIKDLPIYKDKTLQLGPHLHLQIDDRPIQSIYNPTESVQLQDLEPGTHTLRLFAVRPWDESFKNDGSFAQVTFHVFTKTDDNQPKENQPLLTYNQPQGIYGAEPILLDFYLTNAPLHLIAQENDSDSIQDWKVKATVNGQSFLLDRWQSTYLTGFKPGKNWVQLEFIDQNGNHVENLGNNTARIFNYQPNGQDPIAQLTRGELTIAQAKGIVDPNYVPPAPPKPVEAPIEAKEAKPEVKSEVKPEAKPEAVTPLAKPPSGIVPIIPIPLPQKAPELKAPVKAKPIEAKSPVSTPEPAKPEVKSEAKPDNTAEPAPKPKAKKIIQKLLPAFMGPGKKIDVKTPLAKPPGTGIVAPAKTPTVAPAKSTQQKPVETKSVEIKPTNKQTTATKPVETKTLEKKPESKQDNWFDRFRKPADKPSDTTISPEATTEVKPEIKSDAKPTQVAIPKQPIEPKFTDPKPQEQNTQRKPAIEARKSFKFNFGSNKKAETKIETKTTSPIPTDSLKPTIIPTPQSSPTPALTAKDKPKEDKSEDQAKSTNWLDRFRKPAAEKAESESADTNLKDIKLDDIKLDNIKPEAIQTKAIQTKAIKEPLKQEEKKVPATINSTRSEPRKPLQITPGKKVEVKTPIKPEIKPQPKPQSTPQPKPEAKSQTKPEVKIPIKPETKQTFTPQPKPEIKPQAKPEVKVPAKPEVKVPEVKVPIKPETKQTFTPQPKPEVKTQIKPFIKPEPKPTTKPTTKPNLSVPTPTQTTPPKNIPQNTIKPIAKPTEIKPIAKPNAATPTEEKASPQKPNSDKYDYLKEYLNNPTPKTETSTVTKSS